MVAGSNHKSGDHFVDPALVITSAVMFAASAAIARAVAAVIRAIVAAGPGAQGTGLTIVVGPGRRIIGEVMVGRVVATHGSIAVFAMYGSGDDGAIGQGHLNGAHGADRHAAAHAGDL